MGLDRVRSILSLFGYELEISKQKEVKSGKSKSLKKGGDHEHEDFQSNPFISHVIPKNTNNQSIRKLDGYRKIALKELIKPACPLNAEAEHLSFLSK